MPGLIERRSLVTFRRVQCYVKNKNLIETVVIDLYKKERARLVGQKLRGY